MSTRRAPAAAAPVPILRKACAGGGGCPRRGRGATAQTALVVSSPEDNLEREAEAIADRVMHGNAASVATPNGNSVQRAARRSDSAAMPQAPALLTRGLGSASQPLEVSTRSFMESRFGADFAQVRVHANAEAAASAHAIDAHAYTVGDRIVFGAGRYAPHTSAGRRLIAHELAHVVQQAGGAGAISTAPRHAIQRYGRKKSCGEDFLKNYIWPGVDLAKKMMPHALNSFCAAQFGNATKRNRHARGQMESVFGKDWKDKDAQIYETLWRLRSAVQGGNFIFDCLHDCAVETTPGTETDYAHSHPGEGEDGTIQLCVESLEADDLQHFALVLLHELGHLDLNLDHGKDKNSWDCFGDLSDAQCFGLLAQRMWHYVNPVYSTPIGDLCLGGGSAATKDPASWD